MPVLVPCVGCRRHVRSDERGCPFCGADVPEDAASRAVPAATRRLDRVAFFTFATTLAAMACSTGGAGGVDDAGSASDGRVRDDGGMQGAYGQPFDANAQPPYGVGPFDAFVEPPDAGDASTPDTGDPSDARDD